MEKHKKNYYLIAPLIIIYIICMNVDLVAAQNYLYPTPLENSSPVDCETTVLRETGRKSLMMHFKYLLPDYSESDEGFPLDMSSAEVRLLFGSETNPCTTEIPCETDPTCTSKTCTEGINPDPDECSYTVLDGMDADGNLDTVKVVYNGDFPPNYWMRLAVSGVIGDDGTAQDTSSPNTIKFKTVSTEDDDLRGSAGIEFVFDISGSMGNPAEPGGVKTRMEVLKDALQAFYAEDPDTGAPGGLIIDYAMLGDKIGVVYFTTGPDAIVYDPTPGGSNFEPAHDVDKVALIFDDINSQVPTSLTSIGAGLKAANDAGFAQESAELTKYVLLFSDGEQNSDPEITVTGTNLQINGDVYPSDIEVCPIIAQTTQTAPGFVLMQSMAIDCDYACIQPGDETFVTADLETHFTQAMTDIFVGDKLELIKDVIGDITQGENTEEHFMVNSADRALSVYLSWSTASASSDGFTLPIQLIAPNGDDNVIDLTDRMIVGRNMSFITIRFPLWLDGSVIDTKGEWTIQLLGENSQSNISYHLIVLTDNATLSSDFSIDANDIGTGQAIPIRVKLTDDGIPIQNANVDVQIAGPKFGLGDILSTTPTPGGMTGNAPDSPQTPSQVKLFLLLQDLAFKKLLENRSLPSLTLRDNGNAANGDTVAGDGIYSGLFQQARKEGHYHFQVTVQGSSPTNGEFQRTRKLVVFVRPKAVKHTTELCPKSTTPQGDGSVIVTLTATPRDVFGNYIGPGYSDHMEILSSEGTVVSPLRDMLNGSYEISYRLPSAESDPEVTLKIMGDTVIREKLSKLICQLPKWSIGVFGGVTFPHGSLAHGFNESYSFGAVVERQFNQYFSAEAYLGHDHFDSKGTVDDFYFTHFSAHGKLAYGLGKFRPSIHAGLGVYFAETNDTYFGWNVGGGLQYWFSSKFAAEASYNYRNVDGGDFQYSTVHLGIRYAF